MLRQAGLNIFHIVLLAAAIAHSRYQIKCCALNNLSTRRRLRAKQTSAPLSRPCALISKGRLPDLCVCVLARRHEESRRGDAETLQHISCFFAKSIEIEKAERKAITPSLSTKPTTGDEGRPAARIARQSLQMSAIELRCFISMMRPYIGDEKTLINSYIV